MTAEPHFIETPDRAVEQRRLHTLIIGKRTFTIEGPAEMDALLDHPVVTTAFATDEYMPYWADIWPAARMLAEVIAVEPFVSTSDQPLIALELGCGLGVAGVVALSRDVRVIFSDYELTALRFAANNAQRNGFTNFDTLALDWRFPPMGLQVPIILAADLIYEMRNLDPLLTLIEKVLTPDGICLLSDKDRPPATRFRAMLDERGFRFEMTATSSIESNGTIHRGTIYHIRQRAN